MYGHGDNDAVIQEVPPPQKKNKKELTALGMRLKVPTQWPRNQDFLPYLLALVADIVSIFPHGIVKRLLVELGGGGGNGLTLHLVLVLQAHQTLALHILKEVHHWPQNVCELRVGDGRVLCVGECVCVCVCVLYV